MPSAGARWHLRPARITGRARGAGEAPSSSSAAAAAYGSSCHRAGRVHVSARRTEEKTPSPVQARVARDAPPLSELLIWLIRCVGLQRVLLHLLCGNNQPLPSTRATLPEYGNTRGGGGGACVRIVNARARTHTHTHSHTHTQSQPVG